jgi:hypothetical protein
MGPANPLQNFRWCIAGEFRGTISRPRAIPFVHGYERTDFNRVIGGGEWLARYVAPVEKVDGN